MAGDDLRAMEEMHTSLHSTGVISESYRRKLIGLAHRVNQEAYDRGKEAGLAEANGLLSPISVGEVRSNTIAARNILITALSGDTPLQTLAEELEQARHHLNTILHETGVSG